MTTTYYPLKFALTDGQKKETAKSLSFKNCCWSKNQAQANWSRWRHPSHCHSNQSSAESGQILQRSWPQIEPGSDWKYCATRWRPFFCDVGVGTIFDQTSPRGFGQCGTGTGTGPQEVEHYKLVQAMSPAQKKALEKQLVGEGLIRGVVWLNMVAFLVRWRLLEYHLLWAC